MKTDADGFAQLWPTLFLRRELPGADVANAALRSLIASLDAERDDLTTRYRDANLFSQGAPVVDWLRQCIARTALDYLARQGVPGRPEMKLHGWANVNHTGDYHDVHNHPHAYLSGTYYVHMPVQPERSGRRADTTPGAISFYDPRPQANMTAIAGDAQVDPEVTLHPSAGTLLMWPSFVHHFVHPNAAIEPRISVSYNIVLPGAAELVPS